MMDKVQGTTLRGYQSNFNVHSAVETIPYDGRVIAVEKIFCVGLWWERKKGVAYTL